MYNRLNVLNVDNVARKKFLENGLKREVPGPADAELTNTPDWNNPNSPLVAEFDITIRDWASNTGKRWMLPSSLFAAQQKHIFEHSDRIHPIYFAYPFEQDDDVTIELAPGWKTSSVPAPKTQHGLNLSYSSRAESVPNALHLTRTLNSDVYLLNKQYYSEVRNFYQAMRSDDEEQVLLQPPASTASN